MPYGDSRAGAPSARPYQTRTRHDTQKNRVNLAVAKGLLYARIACCMHFMVQFYPSVSQWNALWCAMGIAGARGRGGRSTLYGAVQKLRTITVLFIVWINTCCTTRRPHAEQNSRLPHVLSFFCTVFLCDDFRFLSFPHYHSSSLMELLWSKSILRTRTVSSECPYVIFRRRVMRICA